MEENCVTVCVRRLNALDELVPAGRRLADQSGRALRILLFQDAHSKESGAALEYAFSCARRADAALFALYTGDEARMKAHMRLGTALLLVDAGDGTLLRLGRAAFDEDECAGAYFKNAAHSVFRVPPADGNADSAPPGRLPSLV